MLKFPDHTLSIPCMLNDLSDQCFSLPSKYADSTYTKSAAHNRPEASKLHVVFKLYSFFVKNVMGVFHEFSCEIMRRFAALKISPFSGIFARNCLTFMPCSDCADVL